jgi:hypothetical protein
LTGTPTGASEDNANYGNRGERYLAAVAFLQGRDHNPSAIFTRGYYSYAFAWAVDFDGHRLKTRWLHASRDGKQYSVTDSLRHTTSYDAAPPTSGSGSATLFANGNHNLSVADVDGDGRDELLWGSAALDDDGRVLYATGFGHGDAMHVFAMNPKRQRTCRSSTCMRTKGLTLGISTMPPQERYSSREGPKVLTTDADWQPTSPTRPKGHCSPVPVTAACARQ